MPVRPEVLPIPLDVVFVAVHIQSQLPSRRRTGSPHQELTGRLVLVLMGGKLTILRCLEYSVVRLGRSRVQTRHRVKVQMSQFLFCVLLSSSVARPASPAPGSPGQPAGTAAAAEDRSGSRQDLVARVLTLEERIFWQGQIERVYWRHREWPASNPQPRPAFEDVMPERVLRRKVDDSLRQSTALDQLWGRPITAAQLTAEVERMKAHSRQPEVLAELFAQLEDDPLLIAECLARPILADRLIRNWYAFDSRFHGNLKAHATAERARIASSSELRSLDGQYSEVELIHADGSGRPLEPGQLALDDAEWAARSQSLVARYAPAVAVSGQGAHRRPRWYLPAHRPQSRKMPAVSLWELSWLPRGNRSTLPRWCGPNDRSGNGGKRPQTAIQRILHPLRRPHIGDADGHDARLCRRHMDAGQPTRGANCPSGSLSGLDRIGNGRVGRSDRCRRRDLLP